MTLNLSDIQELPQTNQMTIPEHFRDEMGHMNVMYYMHVYDRAAWGVFALFGVTIEEFQKTKTGMFALRQVVNYLAEVHVGETVAVHSRILGLSAKRLHFIHFMVNETTQMLASTMEVLASHADLDTRRTSPFGDALRHQIETVYTAHRALDWQAPVSGIIHP